MTRMQAVYKLGPDMWLWKLLESQNIGEFSVNLEKAMALRGPIRKQKMLDTLLIEEIKIADLTKVQTLLDSKGR